MTDHLCTKIFKHMLLLYPTGFRSKFGDEMLEVFSEVISDTLKNGDRRLLNAYLHEFSIIPGTAFRERWEEHRSESSQGALYRCRWEGPLSRKELVLALSVFVAPAVIILANFIPPSILALTGPLVLVFLCTMFFTGLIKGFPRWSLPYLGLVLSAFSFLFLFNQTIDLISPYNIINRFQPHAWGESERLLLQAFWAGMMWLSLFVFVFLAIAIAALWQRFRQFYWRLRWDWTQVSFILYSGSILGFILLFDEYSYQEPYLFASLLCLAAGAWLYLRSPKGWQRLFVLLAGITLAMFISAAGKWFIVPRQDWSIYFQRHPAESEIWFFAKRTLLEWGWLVVLLLAPGIMSLLPPPKELETT